VAATASIPAEETQRPKLAVSQRPLADRITKGRSIPTADNMQSTVGGRMAGSIIALIAPGRTGVAQQRSWRVKGEGDL